MFYIFTLLSFTISICGQSLGQTTNEIIFSDNGKKIELSWTLSIIGKIKLIIPAELNF